MPRTTATLVKKIITVDPGDDLSEPISIANNLTTAVPAAVLKPDGTPYLDATTLEMVERYLAAHFYSVLKPRSQSEGVGTVQQTIESSVKVGLRVTRHGQQAILLDITGALAALDNTQETIKTFLPGSKLKPTVLWAGTPKCN